MTDLISILHIAAFSLSSIACAFAALWIYRKGSSNHSGRAMLITALSVTAVWSASAAASHPVSQYLEIIRNSAWILLILRLFALDGRDQTLRAARYVVGALIFVEVGKLFVLVLGANIPNVPGVDAVLFETIAVLHMLTAIGALMLVHNLYGAASPQARESLRWSSGALFALWAIELNHYTVVFFSGTTISELALLRPVALAVICVPLALTASRSGSAKLISPSRNLAFSSFSLVIISLYLLVMAGLAQSLTIMSGDGARLAQIGLVVAAAVFGLWWLPSKRMRGWMRVMLAKHLFRHRYDYRAEWLRFNATMSVSPGDGEGVSLQHRAVKAMADLTDSGAGLLLMTNDDGAMDLAARWEWKSLDVPAEAMSYDAVQMLERENVIVDLDQVRSGSEHAGEGQHVPQWLIEAQKAWAMVPLSHQGRLIGAIVLARPAFERALDWEDFDLLRVVGEQIANYLAEHEGQEALEQAQRFDQFNRRMAFVMHDIKNLSSQMSLLVKNADKHADNPDFRADMLLTLRNSTEKLNALLARLGSYRQGAPSQHGEVELLAAVKKASSIYERAGRIDLVPLAEPSVAGDAEALEQAIGHLVRNGIDASKEGQPVIVTIDQKDDQAIVEIRDIGDGMTPEFVRSELFKPFVSSKDGGFGIGAFEARELIRAMGGQLEVESREGVGTCFTIRLPLLNRNQDPQQVAA